jgi:hypothetical protein
LTGRFLALIVLLGVVTPVAARGADELRIETEDWVLTAPTALGTQADLEFMGRHVQICTDEIRRLVGHRPRNVAKFTVRWIVDGLSVSYATPVGFESHVDASYRLMTPETRAFLEPRVARSLCFGPHEITHVLTWESWGMGWPNEGFATFTDRLYSREWRCCGDPGSFFTCDETGYLDGLTHVSYTDLRRFTVDTQSYHTAACLWLEVYRRGGFRAIRKILAASRIEQPRTPAALAAYTNSVLGADIRPVMMRYGFAAGDLATDGITVPPAIDPIGCVVPRVVGRTLAAARARVAGAGCAVGAVTRVKSTRRASTVLSQRPAAGRTLPEGAKVHLRISRGQR